MDNQNKIISQLEKQEPFSNLHSDELNWLFETSSLLRYKPGQILVRPDEIPRHILIVISGTIRLLAKSSNDEPFTLDKRGSGQLIGWISLLRAQPTEWIIASDETMVLAVPTEKFVDILKKNKLFSDFFFRLPNIHESYQVLSEAASNSCYLSSNWEDDLHKTLAKVSILNIFDKAKDNSFDQEHYYFLSSYLAQGIDQVIPLSPGDTLEKLGSFAFPLRILKFLVILQMVCHHPFNHGSKSC